jgi:hypothetical protein
MEDFEMDHSPESNDCMMTELPYSIEDSPELGRHLVSLFPRLSSLCRCPFG